MSMSGKMTNWVEGKMTIQLLDLPIPEGAHLLSDRSAPKNVWHEIFHRFFPRKEKHQGDLERNCFPCPPLALNAPVIKKKKKDE
ncbi:hypothetical protein AVEN_65518-1 [Araneus ventricosus]|uniref:Uncharacterized protein n=1 Tax=Araneus ventricosus TaxID=182803 RepID=A0A4Y2FF00_ARAVE|nr:hypothetical protein AVEN_65518-1 [Araneus ventricosus]